MGEMWSHLEADISQLPIYLQFKFLPDFSGGPVVKSSHSYSRGAALIPGWGTKILHAKWRDQKRKTLSLDVVHIVYPAHLASQLDVQ